MYSLGPAPFSTHQGVDTGPLVVFIFPGRPQFSGNKPQTENYLRNAEFRIISNKIPKNPQADHGAG